MAFANADQRRGSGAIHLREAPVHWPVLPSCWIAEDCEGARRQLLRFDVP
jgi:hypothetical protein